MLPSRAELRVASVSSPSLWADKVTSWSDVYGFDMSTLVRPATLFAEPLVEVLQAGDVSSTTATLRAFDLTHMARSEQDIACAPFALTLLRGGDVHGLAVWFDIGFTADVLDVAKLRSDAAPAATPAGGDDELPPLEAHPQASASAQPPPSAEPPLDSFSPDDGVFFSTGPHCTPTHWQQTLLLLQEPIVGLAAGEVLRGTLSMSRDADNPREYRFVVDVTAPSPTARRSQAFHMR